MSAQKNRHGFAAILIIIVVLILAVGAVVILKSKSQPYQNPQKETSVTGDNSSPCPTQTTDSETVTNPTSKQLTTSDVQVKRIPIKVGFDTADRMDEPADWLKMANGHYIVVPENSNKIVYDGKEIYSSEKLETQVSISENGLHYSFTVANAETTDLYVDGVKVDTREKMSDAKVTNDGCYFYTLADANRNSRTILTKNGKEIFKTPGTEFIQDYLVSSDGSSYLIMTRFEPIGPTLYKGKIYLNGKEIHEGEVDISSSFRLTPNGKHYSFRAYTVGGASIFIDGKEILKGTYADKTSGELDQLTDLGHYTISFNWITRLGQKLVDGKPYKACDCKPNSRNGQTLYINEDASIILIHDGEKWTKDGETINIGKANGEVEIDGNKIYVYELTP